MRNLAPYESRYPDDNSVVLHNETGSPRTYVVHAQHFPGSGSQLAHLMNGAFKNGYAQAQADMRAALGLKD